jgi:DNA-binding MarR family transcriptional regulator
MLEDLLRRVAEKGTASSAELARELGVSPALMQGLLAELDRQGYALKMIAGCGLPCAGCPLRTACLYRRAPRVWSLTAKGVGLLERRRRSYSPPSSSSFK